MNIPLLLRLNLLVTDIGFVAYWLITAFGLLPPQWLFQDYADRSWWPGIGRLHPSTSSPASAAFTRFI